MGRKNVSLPDDLEASVRELLPDLNVSAVLQDALRKLELGVPGADLALLPRPPRSAREARR